MTILLFWFTLKKFLVMEVNMPSSLVVGLDQLNLVFSRSALSTVEPRSLERSEFLRSLHLSFFTSLPMTSHSILRIFFMAHRFLSALTWVTRLREVLTVSSPSVSRLWLDLEKNWSWPDWELWRVSFSRRHHLASCNLLYVSDFSFSA